MIGRKKPNNIIKAKLELKTPLVLLQGRLIHY